MAAARWEELLPKWNRAAWGLHQQLAWGNPPNWKMLQQTTARTFTVCGSHQHLFQALPCVLSLLVLLFLFLTSPWSSCYDHAILYLLGLQKDGELFHIYWNSNISSGLSRLSRGWLKKLHGSIKVVGYFFYYYYFCFVFDESYASFRGRKSIVMWLIEERFCKQQFIAQDAFGNCMVMQTSAPEGKHPVVPSV